MVDLADLNARATEDVLAWFECDRRRTDRLRLIRSHGTIATPDRPARIGLSAGNLQRFRAWAAWSV